MVATHDVVYYASFLITVPFCHGSSGSRSSYLRYIRAITTLGSSILPLSGVSLTKNSSKDPPYVTDVTLNTLSLFFSTCQNHKSWNHQSYQEITISFQIDRKFHRIDVPSSFKFSSITWNYEPRRFHPLSAHSDALSARREPRDYISVDDSAEQEKSGHI